MPSYDYGRLQDLYAQLLAQQQQASQERVSRLADILNGMNTPPKTPFGNLGGQKIGGAPKWNSIAEMNADLARRRLIKKPKPIDKAARIAEIHKELDIIRGVVPTPKGYKVDPSNVKALMAELKELGK